MAYSRIKDLRQQRADLTNEMEGLLQRCSDENFREFTAEESAEYEKKKVALERVVKHLAVEEEQEQANMRLAPLGASRGAPQWAPGQANFESHRARLEQMQQKPGAQGRRYGDLFPNAGDSGGFTSGEEWLRTVASGMSDGRILQMNAATHLEGVGSSGGFVVPEVLSRAWLDASLENEIVRPRCQVVPMTSESLKVAGFDISDMSTASPFGFKPEWSMENSDATPQTGKFRVIELHSKKLRLYSEASTELVMDGNDFESQVGQAMIAAIGWGLDDACLSSGTGAGMPKSILNDAALITVAKEAGQANGTILYENILKMFARLHPNAMKGAVWVANATTLPQLLTMSVGIGAAGALMPAVKESNGTFSLLGMELLFTEKLPVLGQKGDILLVNFSNYVLGLRKEVVLEKSNAPGWGRDVMSYRVILRADAQGKWNKAQTPKNGDSRSWCVALAAR
ncbi:MAG: phage major capsid protein [Deltaproteobacteria bacterium]|nr:phage major capsid protein [Deltaproteobacteria bacterium]